MTLLYPFYESPVRKTVLEALSQACRSVEPFDVSLPILDRFGHGSSSTIWLKPDPTAALCDLHNILWLACPECNDVRRHEGGFTPHLSVEQVKGAGAWVSILETLQNTWSPLTFCADRITLIGRNDPPEDVFRPVWEVMLGTGEIVEFSDEKGACYAHE